MNLCIISWVCWNCCVLFDLHWHVSLQYKRCYICGGFFGANFGQPVCSTCHLFLFPDDINLYEDGAPIVEVSFLCCCFFVVVFYFLAYWPIGHKLLAWPGVIGVVGVGGVVVVNNFFQPLLPRNNCTEYNQIIYTASLYRGLLKFLIACWSDCWCWSYSNHNVIIYLSPWNI